MSTATHTSPAAAPAFTPSHDFVSEYRERGYTVVRGVFRPEEIAELRRSFDRAYAEGLTHHSTWRHGNRVFWPQEHPTIGRFVSGCQWQSWVDPVLNRIRTDPRMLAILKPLIGDDLKQIINQMHWKTPGSGQTWGMHQDVRSRKPDHCFRDLANSYVQTGIAIDRHWKDNGAMQVIPFSHRRGQMPEATVSNLANQERLEQYRTQGVDINAAVDVEMEPGDVALWGPYMIHGGGINVTPDNFRRLYINGYVIAKNCDRGQPVFDQGKPVPLTIPALIQYEQLYSRTEPHYPEDKAAHIQRD
jgi:ectoine hydroxylase-related dioxygenase (phytanoyl-CoA dioxygenase family)